MWRDREATHSRWAFTYRNQNEFEPVLNANQRMLKPSVDAAKQEEKLKQQFTTTIKTRYLPGIWLLINKKRGKNGKKKPQ